MELRERITLGLEGLTVHRLRTVLTSLGIIFGVAAVIAMMAIGEGAKQEALRKFQALGVNNIIVRDRKLTDQELEEARAKFSAGLSLRDLEAIRQIVPTIDDAAAQAELEIEAQASDRSAKCMLVGVTPSYAQLLNYVTRQGTFISAYHNDAEMRVCVLGAEVARDLFPVESPVGRRVKLDDEWFDVIGIVGEKALFTETVGELAARNLNQDVYVPLETFLRRFARENPLASEIDQLTLQVNENADLLQTSAVVRRIIDRRHRGNEDFDLVIPYELLKQEERERRIYNMVLGSIAAISLLVGGIGITNIMLATVLERTREIGIRRALGANRRDILAQFLTEAVGLSLVGGLIGVVLGVSMALIIDTLAEFKTVLSPVAIVLAFGLSGAVGVLSGTMPARRAAEINPIEALRYE